MISITLFGYAIDVIVLCAGVVLGAGVCVSISLAVKAFSTKKKELPAFGKIKENLLRAYQGNKESADKINELWKTFDELENEAQKIQ